MQLIHGLAVGAYPGLEPALHRAAGGEIDLFGASAFCQSQQAVREHALCLAEQMRGVVIDLERRLAGDALQAVPQRLDHLRLVGAGRRGGLDARRLFNVDDVGNQHRMVRGHGTTRFGDDVRMWQLALGADFPERVHDVVRILFDAVVHGTERARARALVVHAQTAADVHGRHRRALVA